MVGMSGPCTRGSDCPSHELRNQRQFEAQPPQVPLPTGTEAAKRPAGAESRLIPGTVVAYENRRLPRKGFSRVFVFDGPNYNLIKHLSWEGLVLSLLER